MGRVEGAVDVNGQEAVIAPNPALRILRSVVPPPVETLVEKDSLETGLSRFVSEVPLDRPEQQRIMREAWLSLGYHMPNFPEHFMLDDGLPDWKRYSGRIAPFLMFDSLRDYEEIGIRAREVFPNNKFLPDVSPVRILDNDYGVFPPLADNPTHVVTQEDGSLHVMLSPTRNTLQNRRAYLDELAQKGDAVPYGNATWVFLSRHAPGEAPIEHGIFWQLLYQANGTPPAEDQQIIASDAIYRLPRGSHLMELSRLIAVQWRAKGREGRGQIRVGDVDMVHGTQPLAPLTPGLGLAALRKITQREDPHNLHDISGLHPKIHALRHPRD